MPSKPTASTAPKAPSARKTSSVPKAPSARKTSSVPDTLRYYTYTSPYGPLTIQASPAGITAIAFNARAMSGTRAATALTNRAATQIHEYLAGKRFDFDCALDLQGSDFQKRVWREVATLAYGQVVTPRDIAARIGNPRAYRSVGAALRQCTLAPLVPIHRVTHTPARDKNALYQAFRALERAPGRTSQL